MARGRTFWRAPVPRAHSACAGLDANSASKLVFIDWTPKPLVNRRVISLDTVASLARYKLRSPSKLGGAPLYMGFLYGVKIARLDDYMGFLYGAPPDLTVHFWAQKTQNNVSQKAQMLLQKIVTDSLPPPRFTASTTTLVSLPGRKPVLTTLARVPDPVVRVWTARKICVANPTQKKKNLLHFSITARTWRLGTFWVL